MLIDIQPGIFKRVTSSHKMHSLDEMRVCHSAFRFSVLHCTVRSFSCITLQKHPVASIPLF